MDDREDDGGSSASALPIFGFDSMKKSSCSFPVFRDIHNPRIPTGCCFSLRHKSRFKSFRGLESLAAQGHRLPKVEGSTPVRWKYSLTGVGVGGRIHLDWWKDSPSISGRIHPLWVEGITPVGWKKTPPRGHCRPLMGAEPRIWSCTEANVRAAATKTRFSVGGSRRKVEENTPCHLVRRRVEEFTPRLVRFRHSKGGRIHLPITKVERNLTWLPPSV